MLNLNINDHSILSHIVVPFFNKLNFLTKNKNYIIKIEKHIRIKNTWLAFI
jgi:hypothetical protein